MSYNHYLPKGKVSLKPKKHHGFQVVLFFLGWLLPPLAVAARFGIGKDILTLCGYIPGHGHNFYIQNIRNNTNRARTPKWAIRYGLVDPSNQTRRAQKSAWSKRYDERLPESTLVGQELADGEEGPNWDAARTKQNQRRQTEGLWDREDEQYYNEEDEAPNQRNWHYPANFEGAVGDGRSKRRQQVESGDRWERTRSATDDSYGSYPPGGSAATDDDVPEWGRDYGRRKNSTGRSKKPSNSSYDDNSSIDSRDQRDQRQPQQQQQKKSNNPDDVFNHEF
ncbi:hypothetical protein Q8F55_000515 [Vanrija albida]|uniref:Uncharacterized protein n=1 Tax=Vanrija albida TaxID=181172 RepID=A0ABR3QDI5_9TREE